MTGLNVKRKKILLTVLVLTAVLAVLVTGTVFAVLPDNSQSGSYTTTPSPNASAGVAGSDNYVVGLVGEGYASSASITISDASGFVSGVSNGFSSDLKLVSDIDLSNQSESSLFNSGTSDGPVASSGTFDGQGHTITLGSFSRTYSSGTHYSGQYNSNPLLAVGLFGAYGNGATVKNVTIKVTGNVTLTSQTNALFAVGLVFGWAKNATVENVKIVIESGATFKSVETASGGMEHALGAVAGIGGLNGSSSVTLNNVQVVVNGSLVLQHASVSSSSNRDHIGLGGLIGQADNVTFNGTGLFGSGNIELANAAYCWTGIGGFVGFARSAEAKGDNGGIFNGGSQIAFQGNQYYGFSGSMYASTTPAECWKGVVVGDATGATFNMPTLYASATVGDATGRANSVTISTTYNVSLRYNLADLSVGDVLINPLYTASTGSVGSPVVYIADETKNSAVKGLTGASAAYWSGNGYAVLGNSSESFSFVTALADVYRVGEVSSDYSGTGTEISSWSSSANGSATRLTSDVTASSFKTGAFSADFDGQGHTVYIASDISVGATSGDSSYYSGKQLNYSGLFGTVATGGTLKNVTVVVKSGVTVTMTNSADTMFASGLLFGWAKNVTVENVKIVVESGATVKSVQSSASGAESALGLVAGIGGHNNSSSLKLNNVQIVLDGELVHSNGSTSSSYADHVGVGGFVGQSDYTILDACGLFGKGKINLVDSSDCWTGTGGFVGFARVNTATGKNGGCFNGSSIVRFNGNQFYGFTGSISSSSSSANEKWVGTIIGDATEGTYTVPTIYRSTDTGTLYGRGASVSITTAYTVTATDVLINAKYCDIYGYTDGVVAIYNGDLPVTGIENALNASYNASDEYVALETNANSSFTWKLYAYGYFWTTGRIVDTPGTVYSSYSPDNSDRVRTISSAAEWKSVFSDGKSSAALYRLTSDITITDFTGSAVSFSGYLDGAGHTVTIASASAWSSSRTYDIGNTALYLYGGVAGVNRGTIRNLNVIFSSAVTVPDTNAIFGGIAAVNTGLVENVSVTYSAGVTSASSKAVFGGITGYLDGGTVNYVKVDLQSAVSLTSTSSYDNILGGIAGYTNGGVIDLAVLQGSTSGLLHISSKSAYKVGKVIGRNGTLTGYSVYTSEQTSVPVFVDGYAEDISVAGDSVYSYGTLLYTIIDNTNASGLNKIFFSSREVTIDASWDGSSYEEDTDTYVSIHIDYIGTQDVKASFTDDFVYDASEYDGHRVYFEGRSTGTYVIDWLETLDSESLREYFESSGTIEGGMKALGENVILSGVTFGDKTISSDSGIDGAGMTVTVTGSSSVNGNGLFASVNNGTFRNLNLVIEGTLTVSRDVFGLIAGINNGNISKVTVTVKGSLVVNGASYAGIVVGQNNSTLSDVDSVVSSSVTFNGTALGGSSDSSALDAGGVAGSSLGTITDSSTTITKSGSLNANGPSALNFGGLVGYAEGGRFYGNTLSIDGTLNANSADTAKDASYVNLGGLVGYLKDTSAEYSYNEGKGTLSVSGNNTSAMAIGLFYGKTEYSSSQVLSVISEYDGTVPSVTGAKVGRIVGDLDGNSDNNATLSVYYYSSGMYNNFVGGADSSTDTRVDHNRIDATVVSDVVLKLYGNASTFYKVAATSTKPFYGIKNVSSDESTQEPFAVYDKNSGLVFISPSSTVHQTIYWTWIDTYDGNTVLDSTVIYGEDHMALKVPAYTDGYLTDTGRIVAGYSIVSTAFEIKDQSSLSTWLGIAKYEENGSIYYRNGSTEYTKAQYEYAYLSQDVTLTQSVFFNTQGVLASDRTLDGAGHTIYSTVNKGWNDSETQSANIVSYSTDSSSKYVSYGLEKLGNTTNVALTGGLMSVNNGTIKNVTYNVLSGKNQFTNDTQVGAKGLNWIHGFICAINKGSIENVSVILDGDVRLHTDSDSTDNHTYMMGGVAGYNYGGTVSYATVSIGASGMFNHSPRGGKSAFGGVVGQSYGGTLDHLILEGSGTIKLHDLRCSYDDNYSMGGIIGKATDTSLSYLYNGFIGEYHLDLNFNSAKPSTSTISALYFGLIAGVLNTTSTSNIPGVVFTYSGSSYEWVSPGNAKTNSAGSYTYASTVYPFGYVDGSVSYIGTSVNHFTEMGYNGYFDYWTRNDSSNNGFAIEFESPVRISSVTVSSAMNGVRYSSSEYRVYFPSSALSSSSYKNTKTITSVTLKRNDSWDSTLQSAKGYFDYGTRSNSDDSNVRGGGMVTTGTQITSDTSLPLTGSGTYYLAGNVTINVINKLSGGVNREFSGIIYGNGYTLTLNGGSSGLWTHNGKDTEYDTGILVDRLTGYGSVQDLNIVVAEGTMFKHQKASYVIGGNNSNNQKLNVGIVGAMRSENAKIKNCSLTIAGEINGYQNKDVDNGAIRVGGMVGLVSAGTINKVSLEITDTGAVTADGYKTDDKRPDIFLGGLVGYANSSSTITNIVLSGNGTIYNRKGYNATANALIGLYNCDAAPNNIKNIILDSCGFNRSIVENRDGDSGVSRGKGLLTTNSWSGEISNLTSYTYVISSGQNTENFYYYAYSGTFGSGPYTGTPGWSQRYYAGLLDNDLNATVTVSRGSDDGGAALSGDAASMYVDYYAYIDSSTLKVAEKYILRNSHRGLFFWNAGEHSLVGRDLSEAKYTVNSEDHSLHYNLGIGKKTQLLVVDGRGHVMGSTYVADGATKTYSVLESRYYDGTTKMYAVFDTIEEAVSIGLITEEEVSNMTELEKKKFLENKYQYSYQLFDLSGTTALKYDNWVTDSEYIVMEKGLFLDDAFPSDTSSSAQQPTVREIGVADGNVASFYFYNSDSLLLADVNDTTFVAYTQRIKTVALIAAPAYSDSWNEETTVNFYVPLGEDGAITRLAFWSDGSGGNRLLADKDYDIYAYSSATTDSPGGVTYTFNTEGLRGGTTYYVEGLKAGSDGVYRTVTGRVSVSVKIDTEAPVIGIKEKDGSVREDITSDDVTYSSDDRGKYGEIKLYVRDVSMSVEETGVSDNSGYNVTVSPLNAGVNLFVTTSEDNYGIFYTVRLYDSANLTFRATDALDRTSSVKFSIDIVAPSMVVNTQIASYGDVRFINNASHKIYVSSLSDNLTGITALKESLVWSVVDESTGAVVIEGTGMGSDNDISLTLDNLYVPAATIRVSVKDACGNETVVEEKGVLIDTREYRLYYGESLINNEDQVSLTVRPTFAVTYGSTGTTANISYNNNGYITLHRFDAFSVLRLENTLSGLTYIGFGVDVDYVKRDNRDLEYRQEHLEIDVLSNNTVVLDGGTYSGVSMGSPDDTRVDVKAVFFYTVALDIDITLPSVAYTDADTAPYQVSDIVKSITKTVGGATYSSSVVTPSTFTAYLDMTVRDENGNSVTEIPVDRKGSYTVTFSVRKDDGYDRYYTLGSSSSVFSVNVVKETDKEISFSVGTKNTLTLAYGSSSYGGSWDSEDGVYSPDYVYGWSVSDILDEAYSDGTLSGLLTSDYDAYKAKYGESMFEHLNYTVIKSGSEYAASKITEVGTYDVTAQFRSEITGFDSDNYTYRGTIRFTIVVSKSSFTVTPYKQITTYGNSIDPSAYDVDWDKVSPRDKVAVTLTYSYDPSTLETYYVSSATGARVIVGKLYASQKIIKLFEGTSYEKSYPVIEIDEASLEVRVSAYTFREGVVNTYPQAITTRTAAGEYSGTGGIILSGGSASDYNILIDRSADLVIEKREITVRILNKVKYYNSDDPSSYEWELVDGSFGYQDTQKDFASGIIREYPADGIDQVGNSYRLSGTITNSNYTVTVIDGELTVEPLVLEYFVTGADNMHYGTDKDYFGTLEVKVVNAKKDDDVSATIYYLVGYNESGNPIYTRKDGSDYVGMDEIARNAIANSSRADYFVGKLSVNDTSVTEHKIEWNKPGSYTYKIVATVGNGNYSNYDNLTEDRATSVSGLKLYVVAKDQIVVYGKKLNTSLTENVTYTVEGIDDGDTVTVTGLNIGTRENMSSYGYGKHVGQITLSGFGYTSSKGLTYEIVYVYGSLTIEKASIGINWNTVNTLVYSGTDLKDSFTSGVTATDSSLNGKITFRYYDSRGNVVTELKNAGGYRIRAILPTSILTNYKIDADTEYLDVNIDKQPLVLEAFGNSFWNSSTDSKNNTVNNYKFFNQGLSLSQILKEGSGYLRLVDGNGKVVSSSDSAHYSTWSFVVSKEDGTKITHETYGGSSGKSLPTSYQAGTYEVIVTVPDSPNYYGFSERLIFVVDSDTSNGYSFWSGLGKQAGGYYTISKSSTTLTGLATNAGFIAGKGSSGAGKVNNGSGSTTLKSSGIDNASPEWSVFYVNIELSDEYFMLAQQGLLKLTVSGVSTSYRQPGNASAWWYNNPDGTAVAVRGINNARNYYFGTSGLGETALNPSNSSITKSNIYSTITSSMSNQFGAKVVREPNTGTTYNQTFTLSWVPTQSSYRLYFFGWVHADDTCNSKGWLDYEFKNLQITAEVTSNTAAGYTQSYVDNSIDDNSSDTVHFNKTVAASAGTLNTTDKWFILSGVKYYYNDGKVYSDSARASQMYGWSVTDTANLISVKYLTDYSPGARTWKFVVGNESSVAINPETFSIKLKLSSGSETWSVKNGDIRIIDITNNYNRITFETRLLPSDVVSMTSFSILNFAGAQTSIDGGVVYLDNASGGVTSLKVSDTPDGAQTDFDENVWYNGGKYLSFKVSEDKSSGFSGLDASTSVSLYYLDNGKETPVGVEYKSTETSSSVITALNMRTTEKLTRCGYYFIKIVDKQGNTFVYTFYFHYDVTDENILEITVPELSDGWYDSDVTIVAKVNIDFDNSVDLSIGKLQFLVTDKDVWSNNTYKTAYEDDWRSLTLTKKDGEYCSEITLKDSGEKYYVFRYVTGAGNIVYRNLGLVRIDKKTPEIAVTVADPDTDNLVVSDKWVKGDVVFYINGTYGISGGTLYYSDLGSSSAVWYDKDSLSQPARLAFVDEDGRYYATLTVSATSYQESSYAIKFVSGTGVTVYAVFGNESRDFELKIDNSAPNVKADSPLWQSEPQDTLIDISEQGSGIGKVIVEEIDKSTGRVLAYFTTDGAYCGSYADGGTTPYMDNIYSVLTVSDPAVMRAALDSAYAGRVFLYTGDATADFEKNAYYRITSDGASEKLTVPTYDNATDFYAILGDSNIDKYYYYAGPSSGDLVNNTLYKVVMRDSEAVFSAQTVGAARTVTVSGNSYYFRFGEYKYSIYAIDNVGNSGECHDYVPKVDNYQPTLGVIALAYYDYSEVDFVLYESDSAPDLDTIKNNGVKVFMQDDSDTPSFYVLIAVIDGVYRYYVSDGSMIEDGIFTSDKVHALNTRHAFTLSFDTALLGEIASVNFYPYDARIEVLTVDGQKGHGVDNAFSADSGIFTDKTVRFIVTEWTVGPSGGKLMYSNGVSSIMGDWKPLSVVSSFSADETYRDLSSDYVYIETQAEGSESFTFFYRSVSNISVYYNFKYHRSETSLPSAIASGDYDFVVSIDRTSPEVTEVEYYDGISWQGNLSGKTDWWTYLNGSEGLEIRFTATDKAKNNGTATSGIVSVSVTDGDGNEMPLTVDGGYYRFVADKTSRYVITVVDEVGNMYIQPLSQAGGQGILVDLVEPTLDVTLTSDGHPYSDSSYANADVIFDITAEFGSSGGTVYVEMLDLLESVYKIVKIFSDGESMTFVVSEFTDGSTYRIRSVSGAGIEKISSAYRIMLDKISPTVNNMTFYDHESGSLLNKDILTEWIRSSADVTFGVGDEGTGVHEVFLKVDDGEYNLMTADRGVYRISDIKDTTPYYVKVTDFAGNERVYKYVFLVDALDPEITSVTFTKEDGTAYVPSTWSTEKVTVTFETIFSVSDSTLAGRIEYKTVGSDTWYVLTEEATRVGNRFVYTYVFDNIDATYVFRAYSRSDVAGETSEPYEIKVDAITPTVSVSYDWDFSAKPWAGQNVTVSIGATYGVGGASILIYRDGTVIDTIECVGEASFEADYVIPADMAGLYTFSVINSLKVESSSVSQNVFFDTVQPYVSITTDYVSGTWSDSSVDFNVTVTVGDSYKKMNFFSERDGQKQQLFYTDMSDSFVVTDGSVSGLDYSDGKLTFVYTIFADESSPIVKTSFSLSLTAGNGLGDRNMNYSESDSVMIDVLRPEVTLETVKQSGTQADYVSGEWSMRQIEFVFTVTYYESGVTLRYSTDNNIYNTDSVVRKGSVTTEKVELSSGYYTRYTSSYAYTVSADFDGTVYFRAESGAGKYNADTLSFDVKYDRLDPEIGNVSYFRKNSGDKYNVAYNPSTSGYIRDEKVKVVFTAADVYYNGVASGLASVTVTKNGSPVEVFADSDGYYFFATDSLSYIVQATDNSGRTISRTIKIGLDSIVPELKVNVNGSSSSGVGYSFDGEPEQWRTEPLGFDFDGSVFGTSGVSVRYSFDYLEKLDDAVWFELGDETSVLALRDKITYGSSVSFVAVSGAGVSSDVVTVYLKTDLREYTLTVNQYVGGTYGEYALVEVTSTRASTFKRLEDITIGFLPDDGYRLNYVKYNGSVLDDVASDYFVVTVGSTDLTVDIYFRETVSVSFDESLRTQYLKNSSAASPVSVVDSHGKTLAVTVTYTSTDTLVSTTDITAIGGSEELPLGRYFVEVALVNNVDYLLDTFSEEIELLYFTESGTETDPYIIDGTDDITFVDADIYNRSDRYFALNSDLELTSLRIADVFNAHLDGRNYTISYSELLASDTLNAESIFGTICGSVVNLGIRTGTVKIKLNGTTLWGVLAERLSSGARLSDSFIVSDIELVGEKISSDVRIGGMIGVIEEGAIAENLFTDAYIDATALDASVTIGGIAAETESEITATFSIATVLGTSSAKAYMIAKGVTITPVTSDNRKTVNKAVDGNVYIDGDYRGEDGNVTYYELYTALGNTFGNFTITRSEASSATAVTTVKDLVKGRFDEAFGKDSYVTVDGNIRFSIGTTEQFLNIDRFLWADYIQTADIVLPDNVSVAVGGTFRGKYDGNGRSISFSASVDGDYALFDKVSGSICNLYLSDVSLTADVTVGDVTIALLVRELSGSLGGIVVGGQLDVTVDGASGVRVSAVAGIAKGAEIDNVVSTAFVSVRGDNTTVGAIVAEAIESTTDGVYAVSTVRTVGDNVNVGSVIGSVSSSTLGAGYAFDGNAYLNGTTLKRFVGNLDDSDTGYAYTTVTKLMDNVNGYIVMSASDVYSGYDVYVGDALQELFRGEFSSGIGTSDDPFILSTAEDFEKISRYMYAHYKINLGGSDAITFDDWTTIGEGMNFTGSIVGGLYFDDNGYPHGITLSGLTSSFVDRNYGTIGNIKFVSSVSTVLDSSASIGLVANVNYGVIEKVEVSSVTYVTVKGSGELTFGGIVGDNYGTVSESSASLNATLKAYKIVAGGIVGASTDGVLSNNSVYGQVTAYVSALSSDSRLAALYGASSGDVVTRIADDKDVIGSSLYLNGSLLEPSENI